MLGNVSVTTKEKEKIIHVYKWLYHEVQSSMQRKGDTFWNYGSLRVDGLVQEQLKQ